MYRSLSRIIRRFGVTIAVGAVLASAGVAVASTSTAGVENPGFEQGLDSWRVSAGAADAATVVAVEGSADFPVYTSRGVTVTPRAGQHMLRLGKPRPNGSQPRGVTTVSQTFTPTSSMLRVAVRVFSWEFRSEDAVVIDLRDASGRRVGSCEQRRRSDRDHHEDDRRSGSPFTVTMTDGTVQTNGTMPLEIAPRSRLRNALLDTGWLIVDITGLPVGTPLTLSYSLRTPKDSSHPTWAYFDEVNGPPTVENVSFRTDRNLPLSVPAPGVLVGADDPDGDALEASVVAPTDHGILVLRPDGSFSYAPDYGFVGSDDFTFKASDGQSESQVATASITVDQTNDAPRPDNADVVTDEDTSVHVTLAPTNANGDALTYYIVGPPTSGTLTADAPGDENLEYSPNPHFYGWDSFTYYASDGVLFWDVGTVWIQVRLVNHAPVAEGLEAATNEGTPVGLTMSASDREGDPFTFEIVDGPVNGQLSAIAGDQVTYTPNQSFYGVDTFTYRAKDAAPGAAVTATITVDPLVAMFEYLPTDPREGEDVGVYGDLSHVVKPGVSIVAWNWTVSGPEGLSDDFEGENSFFMPPQQGSYDVTLTVTDTRGAIATTHTVITVVNDEPRVKALDMEVMPGRPATVVGRFLDAGWMDTHTASVSVAGGGLSALALSDQAAELSSGIVTAPVTTELSAGTLSGSLSVSDDGGSATAVFTVTAVQPGADRSVADDTLADRDKITFPKARGDGSYLSYIRSAGDVDLYEVRMPNGDPLPYGTEILASLKELPADYDLAILNELPSTQSQTLDGMQSVPFEQGSMGSTAMRGSAMRGSAMRGSAMRGSAMRGSAMRGSAMRGSAMRGSAMRGSAMRGSAMRGSAMRGSAMRGSYGRYDALEILTFPLSDMSFTGLDTINVSGTDLTLSDLGLSLPTGADIVMAAFSANRGTSDEAALARTETSSDRVYVAVFGANGAFDAGSPYRLEVETAQPLELQDLFKSTTPPAPLVPSPAAMDVEDPTGQAKETLFITQRERFVATYGQSAWDGLATDLSALCTRGDIKGEIVSVPSGIYDAWDTNPSSVEAANAVAEQIRLVIEGRMTENPDIRYVVLVGNDRIVPFRRVADDTVIGNESYYKGSSFLLPDSPLYASLAARCILTDDYYADAAPIPWQGRALYVPDVSVGRLVETPQEIRRSIQAFTEREGVLDPATSLVTGYDFFADGAQASADTLGRAGLSVDPLISDTWTANDLRQRLFGQTSDISEINAHFTHFMGISAYGWANPDVFGAAPSTETLTSAEVASAVSPDGATALWKRIVLTLGCHAGMSMPDTDTVQVNPSYGVDPSLDLPQAMARQGAVYLANTGFGLGDTKGIACSELLSNMYLEELLQNRGTTVGSALTSSKQRYLTSLSALTSYDEKTSIEFTLYGLPQYRVRTGAGPLASAYGASGSVAAAGWFEQIASALSVADAGEFKLSVKDGSAVSESTHALQLVTTDSGKYLAADRDSQASDLRPVQPRVVVPLAHTTAGDVHGVLIGVGAFAETTDFDPVIAQTVTGWEIDPTEFQISNDGFWPASPVTLRSLESTALVQSLIVVPGQFRSTASADATVTGVERVWDNLGVELLRSTSTHWAPPEISAIRLYATSLTTVTVSVETSDAVAGIGTIVVSRLGSTGFSSTTTTPPDPHAGRYMVQVSIPYESLLEELGFMVQVADGDGNVAVSTGKGATMHLVDVTMVAPPTYEPGVEATFEGAIKDFGTLVQPVTYTWDFGDGQTVSGSLAATYPVSEGTAQFSVKHTYTTAGSRLVRLTVSDAAGGTGSIEKTTAAFLPGVPGYAGQFSCAPVGISGVYSMAVAPDGSVYFADPGNSRIKHVSATGAFIGTWGTYGTGEGQFSSPFGVAVAADGSVYVADTFNRRIQRFSATGDFLGKWGAYGTGDGQFKAPYSLAMAPDGSVYVADRDNNRIQRFSATGDFLGKWGTSGTGDGQFNEPYSLALAPDGSVYVADTGNNRVQRFSATGDFLGKWGEPGIGDGQFNAPYSVAVASDTSVYVVDTTNCRVQRFSATGDFLGKWGAYGTGNGQFSTPRGAAVAPDGSVYVVDTNNTRIQYFRYGWVAPTVAWVAPTGSDTNPGTAALPWRTIQKGIDSVAFGGTVNVGPGTYPESVTLRNDVTLLGTAGAEYTSIIGGSETGVVFTGVGVGETIRGFTISGDVSGVSCLYSSPLISECVIKDSHNSKGAGVNIHGGSPTIDACTITGNTASSAGGGVYVSGGGNATLTDTFIIANTAGTNGVDGMGGGVGLVEGAHVSITGGDVSGNSTGGGASARGGGLACLGADSELTISNTHMTCNTTNGFGGAVAVEMGGTANINGGQCWGNSAYYGGAIGASGATILVDTSNLYNNTADCGAGIWAGRGASGWVNTTSIFANVAGSYGGGVYVDGASGTSVTFAYVNITDNRAVSAGGGFASVDGTTYLGYSTVANNATDGSGGGLWYHNSGGQIEECSIGSNTAELDGGGVLLDGGSSVTVIGNNIGGNTAATRGGGVFADAQTGAIRENTFQGNTAQNGGGLYAMDGYFFLAQNRVWANTATLEGGGLFFEGQTSVTKATTNILDRNTAGGSGGGIRTVNAGLQISNNTIADNTAGFAAGIACTGPSTPVVFNNLADNPGGADIAGCAFSYCFVGDGVGVGSGEGNISYEDVGFVDRIDYRLALGSPCIDAGTPAVSFYTPFSPDFDGTTRPFNILWDIGAYEWH
jgi:hypothetical protein